MRNNLAPSRIIPFLLVLLCAAPGAYAQALDDQDEQEQESSTMQSGDDKEAAPPTAETSPPAKAPTHAASSSDTELLGRIESMETAIAKFKMMGVGVTPFENGTQQARTLVAENKLAEADVMVQCLKRGLEDQQRRFYANKMQVWHNQLRPHNKNAHLLAAHVQKNKAGTSAAQNAHNAAHTPGNAAAGLSQGAHNVISKSDAKYTPLIYPIAR